MAAAPNNRPGAIALERLCRRRRNQGRCHPRLNPIDGKDLALFRCVLAGQHVIIGFRNTHIQHRLWPEPPLDAIEAKRRCASVSRQIAKVPRHRLKPYGQRVVSAAIAIAIHDHAFASAYAAVAA